MVLWSPHVHVRLGGSHPWAWHPAAYTAAAWARAVWAVPTAAAVGAWIGATAAYVPYDYGDDVTYQNNYVYYGSEPVATEQEYYQQATAIAGSQPGAAARRAARPRRRSGCPWAYLA